MFSKCAIWKQDGDWYYCGRLMFTNLYGNKDLDCRYGEGMMFVSVKELHTYAVHISNDVKDSDRRSHARIVPAEFNPLCLINDLQ